MAQCNAWRLLDEDKSNGAQSEYQERVTEWDIDIAASVSSPLFIVLSSS